MERPVFKPAGTPVEELDTPALVLDLDILDQNIEALHSFFRQRQAKVRPHIEAHRCPAIAHRQLAAGGTVGGISVTTLGEAEVFAQSGFSDIFVANQIVTPQKIGRLCGLANTIDKVTVAVDNPRNVEDLSEAARGSSVTLRVVVDIHTRLERCGVEPGGPAVELARAVSKAKGLHFAGLMTYEGAILTEDREELEAESRRCIQAVLDTRQMVEGEGMEVEVVSVGGTHNYDIAGEMAGVTEVPAGTYALMDYRYRQHRNQFRSAAKVISTVISRPEPELVFLDCGQKGICGDIGLPVAEDVPDSIIYMMSAEHGHLRIDGDAKSSLKLRDKVWLTPWDIGSCVNLYDYINASRDGRLEAVWDVSARGRYR